MTFLPETFEVPTLLRTEPFHIRPITVHDVVKDYETVMSNRKHLWDLFGEAWGWPAENLTLSRT